MKLRFYCDIWPGVHPGRNAVHATTEPYTKSANCKRIAFDVTIPDSMLFEFDGVAPEVSSPVEIEGGE